MPYATQPRPLRSREDAPDPVEKRGGVALSLWLSGAGETDCLIVAGLSRKVERYLTALERIEASCDGYALKIAREALDV